MAACAWNLRKWLIATAIFLFWQKLGCVWVEVAIFSIVLSKILSVKYSVIGFECLRVVLWLVVWVFKG
ncbi:hypothetical protein BSPWISOXPB_3117 [uncultured Gammaproteobacteria bacterium]|nr:hypothetical protein BSPWISOXPB_3117 [uncultured Gammaproteobacteria bacterium]